MSSSSCKNWFCCCKTIVPKKRPSFDFRKQVPLPKNRRIDTIEDEGTRPSSPDSVDAAKENSAENNDELFRRPVLNSKSVGNSQLSKSQAESDSDERHQITMSEIYNEKLKTRLHKRFLKGDRVFDETENTASEIPNKEIINIQQQHKEPINTPVEVEVEENSTEKNVKQLQPENCSNTDSATVEENQVLEKSNLKVKVSATEVPEIGNKEKATTGDNNVDVEEPKSTGRYNCRNRENFHKCAQCGKVFCQLVTFLRHEKEHMLEETKPCYCTVCNKSYTSVSSFSRHIKTHVQCSLCGNTFSQSESLLVKGSTDTPKSHVCGECRKISPIVESESESEPEPQPIVKKQPIVIKKEKVESTRKLVKRKPGRPFKSSPPEKFQCQFCEKKFLQIGALKTHEKVHNTDTSHFCQQCDKSFNNPTTLKNHQAMHSSQRPFQCAFCPQSFKLRHHAQRHERIHTGEKPYHCPCGFSCNQSQTLKTHQKTKKHKQYVHENMKLEKKEKI